MASLGRSNGDQRHKREERGWHRTHSGLVSGDQTRRQSSVHTVISQPHQPDDGVTMGERGRGSLVTAVSDVITQRASQ